MSDQGRPQNTFSIDYRHFSGIVTEEFEHKYLSVARPLVVSGVLDAKFADPQSETKEMCRYSPWTNANKFGNLKKFAELVNGAEAEVCTQIPNTLEIVGEIVYDASASQCLVDLADGNWGDEPKQIASLSSTVQYVKVPLTGCKDVLEDLELPLFLCSVMGDGDQQINMISYVDHPMLLAPGKSYCWAFAGQQGTGSSAHVDVMHSDAWLVVITGTKRWTMVHPHDKHLVQSVRTGKLPVNLETVSNYPDEFPFAHLARRCTFLQEAGDAVFVPADAPHSVINETDSMSFTYNFIHPVAPGQAAKWGTFFRNMSLVPGDVSRTAMVDLVVSCSTPVIPEVNDICPHDAPLLLLGCAPAPASVVTLRGYAPNVDFLPTTEHRARLLLESLQDGFTTHRQALVDYADVEAGTFNPMEGVTSSTLLDDWTCAVPVGYTTSPSDADHRLIVHYDYTKGQSEFRHFVRALAKRGLVDASSMKQPPVHGGGASPMIVFPITHSHFGKIPMFPPLRVLLNIPTFYEGKLPLVSLSAAVLGPSMRTGPEVNPFPLTMYHYARFPFKGVDAETRDNNSDGMDKQDTEAVSNAVAQGRSPWCATYLFYSSYKMNGPLSLYPLLEDGTLRNVPPCEQAEEKVADPSQPTNFSPHFRAFQWNKTKATEGAMGLIDLGDSLVETITKGVILDPSYNSSLVQRLIPGHRLGVDSTTHAKVDLMTIGIEKIMIPLLWFCNTPGIVGFTYSHTFSSVNEPNTCCLIGSTASSLLKPVLLEALLAETAMQGGSDVGFALGIICHLCGILEGQEPLSMLEELVVGPLEAALLEDRPLVLHALRLWLKTKYDDMLLGLEAIEEGQPLLVEGEGVDNEEGVASQHQISVDDARHKKEVLDGRFEVCWDTLC